jgi:hypothetical protein
LKKATYVGKTTVGATAYLRLVDVDEDARVAEGTAAAVALDGFLLDPADGLFVDELDGCQWARLLSVRISYCSSSTSLPLLLSQFLLYPLPVPRMTCFGGGRTRDIPYLIIHDHLLESRSNHSFLSGLLAAAPHSLPVGRLHASTLFALGNGLLQWLVHVAFAACGGCIGAADWRGCRAVFGVVGGDWVVGQEGAVGGERAGDAAAEQTAAG